jgi:hypothetical protein
MREKESEEKPVHIHRNTLTGNGFQGIVRKVPRGLRNSKPPKT